MEIFHIKIKIWKICLHMMSLVLSILNSIFFFFLGSY